MVSIKVLVKTTSIFICAALLGGCQSQVPDLLGVACSSPPPSHCQSGDCASKIAELGNAVDPETGRAFFLDYPCDLKRGEDVTFVLNVHGAGSIANWQRHYFPVMDLKDTSRLVVATPTAEGAGGFGGASIRMWMPEQDDAHLRNITSQVVAAIGAENVRAFWLAGHSQGGGTSHRLVCTPFFRDKVDGLLSLSGGRVGRAQTVAAFGPPRPDGTPPPPRARQFPARPLPDCDFSHIFTTGEHEIVALPEVSPWAERFKCDARLRGEDIVDTQPGWVTDSNRMGYKVWGMAARPGTAEVFTYPNCANNRVVADVVRIDKGHTEGLEPEVTKAIVKLMQMEPGGKIAGRR